MRIVCSCAGPVVNLEAFGKRPMRDCETTPKPRIAFDLDETLGVPRIEGGTIVGFQSRAGCASLLEQLCRRYTLVLWTVSSRRYLDKVLAFGLRTFFEETYSWDELPASWKDIRKLRLGYLIDDSEHHREAARQF